MGLAVLGLSCFAINYMLPGAGAGTTVGGFALTLCAAAMWAASNIIARRVQQDGSDYSPTAFVVWSSSAAVLPFVLLSLAFDAEAVRWQWMDARPTSWLAVAYLGWVATLVGDSLWTGLLKRHPANRVAPFSLWACLSSGWPLAWGCWASASRRGSAAVLRLSCVRWCA